MRVERRDVVSRDEARICGCGNLQPVVVSTPTSRSTPQYASNSPVSPVLPLSRHRIDVSAQRFLDDVLDQLVLRTLGHRQDQPWRRQSMYERLNEERGDAMGARDADGDCPRWKGAEGRSRLPRIFSVVGSRPKRLMGMIYGKHSIWDTSSHLCCSSLTIYNDVLV